MEPYFTYLIGALLVMGWVLLETWLKYRKLDYFDPTKKEILLNGFTYAVLYGTFWPTALILFGLGKAIPNRRQH